MRRLHYTLILTLAMAVGVCRAQETNAPAVAPVSDVPLSALRDPFWPIGWVPPKMPRPVYIKSAEVAQGPVRWEEVTGKLEVSALSQSKDGSHIAVLKNIGLVGTGDTISVNYGGMTYRWEVLGITASGIQTKRLGVSEQ